MSSIPRPVLVAAVASIASAGTSFAQPTNVSSSSYFGFVQAKNSEGLRVLTVFPAGDPTAGLVTFDEALSIPEPLGGSHTVTAAGQNVAIGSVWSGSGSMSGEYASGLTPGVSLPGDSLPAVGPGTLVANGVLFTLETRTRIILSASADFTILDPVTPSATNGITLQLEEFDAKGGITNVFRREVDRFTATGSESSTDIVDLPAGDYRFTTISRNIIGGSFGSRRSDFEYDYKVTFIPAPATAPLLGLSVIAATRRRR
ncbi:MAG: hypothetical protein AAGJ54_02450 [Planctomycetota bacterium]